MKKIIPFLFACLVCFSANATSIGAFEHASPLKLKNIDFTGGDGYIHSLNEYRGKVVLLNFWATWCVPCVKEMPALAELQKNMEGRDFVVLPISVDYKGIEVVKSFYKNYGVDLPAYIDSKGKSFRKFELKALPTTIIVDKSGDEVARILGEIDWNSNESKRYLINLAAE